jgi:hypothetical protein
LLLTLTGQALFFQSAKRTGERIEVASPLAEGLLCAHPFGQGLLQAVTRHLIGQGFDSGLQSQHLLLGLLSLLTRLAALLLQHHCAITQRPKRKRGLALESFSVTLALPGFVQPALGLIEDFSGKFDRVLLCRQLKIERLELGQGFMERLVSFVATRVDFFKLALETLAIGTGALDLLLELADTQAVVGRFAHRAGERLSRQAQGLARPGRVIFGLHCIGTSLIGHQFEGARFTLEVNKLLLPAQHPVLFAIGRMQAQTRSTDHVASGYDEALSCAQFATTRQRLTGLLQTPQARTPIGQHRIQSGIKRADPLGQGHGPGGRSNRIVGQRMNTRPIGRRDGVQLMKAHPAWRGIVDQAKQSIDLSDLK